MTSEMSQVKPVLVPARVPWAISASAPHLKLNATMAGVPTSLTFIGHFKLKDTSIECYGSSIEIVENPGEFSYSATDGDTPYRMVCISFEGGTKYRQCYSASDHQVIQESEYDWSEIPGALRESNDVLNSIKIANDYLIKTGMSANPRFYEVRSSPWIKELNINDPDLRHYIALGHDDYFEILARDWHWKAGRQA